jgi:hypothetical protein
MPRYYFNLKDSYGEIHVDPDGMDLKGEAQARAHAREVARELMQSREAKTRSWRLQACDADRNVVFELLFVTVDQSMRRFPPLLRDNIERFSIRSASLSDAIFDVRMSLRQLKGTLARSEGAPYLAALNGSRVDP